MSAHKAWLHGAKAAEEVIAVKAQSPCLAEAVRKMTTLWEDDSEPHLYLKGSQPCNKPAVLQVVDGCPQHALHPHLQQVSAILRAQPMDPMMITTIYSSALLKIAYIGLSR